MPASAARIAASGRPRSLSPGTLGRRVLPHELSGFAGLAYTPRRRDSPAQGRRCSGTPRQSRVVAATRSRQGHETDAEPVSDEKTYDRDEAAEGETARRNQFRDPPPMQEAQGQQPHGHEREKDDQRIGEDAIAERLLLGKHSKPHPPDGHQAEPPGQ